MAGNINFDDSDFEKKMQILAQKAEEAQSRASQDIGEELMRLSGFVVPHKKGLLQASGSVQPTYEENGKYITIVGYNKVYAARLHEHPEYHFTQSGPGTRGAKYLENPMKNNLANFQKYYLQSIQQMLV